MVHSVYVTLDNGRYFVLSVVRAYLQAMQEAEKWMPVFHCIGIIEHSAHCRYPLQDNDNEERRQVN